MSGRWFNVGVRSAVMMKGAWTVVGLIIAILGVPSRPAAAQTPGTTGTDGLTPDSVYFEADRLVRDGSAGIVTASGDVEARYQGRVLRADRLTYDTHSGLLTADGHVALFGADGSAQYAEHLVLDDQFSRGVVTAVSGRMADGSQFAASSAIRRSETVNELTNAIYTPCKLCSDAKSTSKPTWTIQAEKVTQDDGRKIMTYRNAVIKVVGIPIFYAPVFWHPTDDSVRSSGILAPRVSVTKRRGLSYEQPYLQTFGSSINLIVSPEFSSRLNPFLNLSWEQRFYSGDLSARFGYTYEGEVTNSGNVYGDKTSRSYVLTSGQFNITPDWKWGFTAERASDSLIFDKYDIGSVYIKRGLIGSDDHRLISQLYTSRQTARSYLSAAVVDIQGLRAADRNNTFPLVAPLIEARWEPVTAVLGGRFRLRGSMVGLTRDQSPTIAGAVGIDTQRLTAEIDWRRTLTSAAGLRMSPFVQVRGDLYRVTDLPAANQNTATMSRGLSVIGADLSFPMVKRIGTRSLIIEPLAQLALSPTVHQDSRLPNEDSTNQQFDETNLFQVNKAPGFDLYEGGQRVNMGMRGTVSWDNGRAAGLLIGRTLRTDSDATFSQASGLRRKASDWIVAAQGSPIQGVTLFSRTRLASKSLDVRRFEAGADIKNANGRGYVRYLSDKLDPSGAKRGDLDVAGEFFLTKRWGVSSYGVLDVQQNVWRRRDLGLIYQDDCLRFEVLYERNETFNRSLGPSEGVQLRLTLATLGDTRYSDMRYGDR